MAITVNCPVCSKRLTIGEEHAGRTGRCPKCKTAFTIPSPSLQDSNMDLAQLQDAVLSGPTGQQVTQTASAHRNTPQFSLETALAKVTGPFTKGLKEKVRETVASDVWVLAAVQAKKEKATERGSKLGVGLLGGLRIDKNIKTEKTPGLLVVTSKRVFHVSKVLWQVSFEQIGLDQIDSVEYDSGLMFGTLRIYGNHNTLQVGVSKAEAKNLCALVNQAITDIKAGPVNTVNVAEQLDRLAILKTQGILNDDDWERAKAAIIGKPPSRIEQVVLTLQSMYALFKQGVLTEGEFNMKKWDVLSKP